MDIITFLDWFFSLTNARRNDVAMLVKTFQRLGMTRFTACEMVYSTFANVPRR